jgi:hypothetical protein
MKRSHDQFLSYNSNAMLPNGSTDNLMKNLGNVKSMNSFAQYQPVSSPKNSMILQNNVNMAPVNFTKPQTVTIQQNIPFSQGYQNSITSSTNDPTTLQTKCATFWPNKQPTSICETESSECTFRAISSSSGAS